MKIRLARPEEEESLQRIMRAAIRAGCTPVYGEETVKAWTAPGNERFLFTIPERSFVAEDSGGRLHGFSGWRCDDGKPPAARITAVFVAPESGKTGLGKALLQRAEDDIRAQGFDKAYLMASLNAVPFYRANGYADGHKEALAVAENHHVAVLRMDKALGKTMGNGAGLPRAGQG